MADYIPPWGGYPTGPEVCGDAGNPSCRPYVDSWGNPLLVSLYSFGGLAVLTLVSRAAANALLRRSEPDAARRSVGPPSPAMGDGLGASLILDKRRQSAAGMDEIRVLGFKDSWGGRFCWWMVNAVTLVLFALYFTIIADFYFECEFTGFDNCCLQGSHPLFGDYDSNSLLILTWWLFALVWFGTLVSLRARVRNWCRVPCRLSQAEHVWVWVRDAETEVIAPSTSWVVAQIKALRELVCPATRGHEGVARVVGGELAPIHDGACCPQSHVLKLRFTPDSQHWCDVCGKRNMPKGTAVHGCRLDNCNWDACKSCHAERLLEAHTGESVPITTHFIFDGTRYNIAEDAVTKATIEVPRTHAEFHSCRGHTMQGHLQRMAQLGPNVIPFTVDSVQTAFVKEFVGYFYLYQILIYSVWMWSSYLIIGSALFSVVIGSGILNISMKRSSQRAIMKLTSYVTDVKVFRGGKWVGRASDDIVPGDRIKIDVGEWVLPCDMVIVEGFAVCDESGLTGESMPGRKSALADDAREAYSPAKDGKHTLFAGTTVLQVGGEGSDYVIAVVTTTGINTSKGQLISTVINPGELSCQYDEEIVVAIAFLVVYSIVCCGASVYLIQNNGSTISWVTTWVYAMFTLSQIISPLLPVSLVVGEQASSKRLSKNGVFCINPKRIAIAGKVRVFCFDKTGTLTKDGLDFRGIQCCNQTAAGPVFQFPMYDSSEFPRQCMQGMATCHAVTTYNKKLVGNEVEVRMFRATGWELDTSGNGTVVKCGDEQLRIVKRFEFDHARMTMSVVCRHPDGNVSVFCKGSAECVGALCDETSLPDNYVSVSERKAAGGWYVIGLGHRALGKLSEEEVAAMGREDCERDLTFLTLLLFRNELKPDSADAIAALKQGAVRPVMVTGDNAQCGFFIAKECGMVSPQATVMLGDVGASGSVVWTQMGEREDVKPMATSEVLALDDPSVELAVTSGGFDWLVAEGHMRTLVAEIRVFARMKPQQKVAVVRMLTARGFIVGMCGDGGNDCGALREAHVGVSLSDAEASLVSPFTSRTKSCASVVQLLCEGRCALATSFAGYKFLITYGQIFSIVKLINYYYGVIMCPQDYLTMDVVIVVWLTIAMSKSKPRAELSSYRPTSSLLGFTTVVSVFGQHLINVAVLVTALVLMRGTEGYIQWPAELSEGRKWWFSGDNWETTVLFVVFAVQLCSSAMIFSYGHLFRASLWRNWSLVAAWLVMVSFVSFLLLSEPNEVVAVWHIASVNFNALGTTSPIWAAYQEAGNAPSEAGMPLSLRWRLLVLTMGGVTASALFEKLVVQGPLRPWPKARGDKV